MMETLELRKLRYSDESAFLKALDQWEHDVGFTWVRGYEKSMDFKKYLQLLESFERDENLPEGYVPDTSLFGFVDNVIVGRLAIRHRLNDFLLNVGGHIGYGVLPPFRRNGYAKRMLALSLPIAKEMGLTKALVTCDENNIGSIKTIEANGGILENKISTGDDKPLKRRYWIHLND